MRLIYEGQTMKTLLSTAALALVCQASFADTQITMLEKHEGMGADGSETVISVRDGKVLFRQAGGPSGSDVIFDAATGNMTQIDHRGKKFMVISKEEMQAGISKASEMMKQMEQQLASLPKEQREMMMQQMKQMPGMPQMGERKAPDVKVEFTGKSQTIAGIDCKMVKITESGEPEGTACIAKTKDLGMSDADFETLASMFDTMRELASMGGNGGSVPDMRELKGYPISYSNPGDGSVSKLISASGDELDAALFEVPASYKRQSMPKF